MRHLIPGRAGRGPCGGFTLVEVMAALFVIVIGVLPVVGVLLSSRGLDRQAQIQAAAYLAARRQVELLRTQPFAGRPSVTQAAFTLPASLTAEFPDVRLTGDYSVVAVPTLGDATHAVQQLVVRVRWTRRDAPGVTSAVRLDTLTTQGAAP